MVTTRDVMTPFLNAAAASPFLIAPERADELLHTIMKGQTWTFELEKPDDKGREGDAQFYALPPAKKIVISAAGLASLWCLTYAAYITMDVTSRVAADPQATTIDVVDLGAIWAKYRLRDMVEYSRRLNLADEAWPPGLDWPKIDAPLDTNDGRINNMFLAAVSWVVLHEIAHVYYDHERFLGRELTLSQEHAADRFAVHWCLERAVGEQREFRVQAMTISMAWLLLFERAKRGGGDHPPAIVRFREAASWFEVNRDSPALENAVYALKAIFDPRFGDMPIGMTASDAFAWIDDRLGELFPRE